MKTIILTLLLLVVSGMSNASTMQLRGGQVSVSAGSPAHLITESLGEPRSKGVETVCKDRARNGKCNSWVERETWFYRYRDLNWTIIVQEGIVQDIKWSRF